MYQNITPLTLQVETQGAQGAKDNASRLLVVSRIVETYPSSESNERQRGTKETQDDADLSRHKVPKNLGRWVRSRQRGENSGVRNPHFYFKKPKMVWWETLGEEKVQFSYWEKQEHASRTHPCSPFLPQHHPLGMRECNGGIASVLLSVCEIKTRRGRGREEAAIFETMRCLCSWASDIVALQGPGEDRWWVQCPVLTRTPETSPKMKGFHLKHRGPTLPWLTQCETGIFNFLPPTTLSEQVHIFYWKCIMTCRLVVSRAGNLLQNVLESAEPRRMSRTRGSYIKLAGWKNKTKQWRNLIYILKGPGMGEEHWSSWPFWSAHCQSLVSYQWLGRDVKALSI